MKNSTGEFFVEAVCASITGEIREENEDNFCFHGMCMPVIHKDLEQILKAQIKGQMIAVFDGIGGLPKGEVASYLAARTMMEEDALWTESEEQNYEALLCQLIEKISGNISEWRKEQKINHMGTTMAALKFGQKKIYGTAIGDSRIYRMRDDRLEQLSSDHIFRRPGHMRSSLTAYLGMENRENFLREYFLCLPYQEGDKYLICSDGLTDMLRESRIASRMRQPIEEAISDLLADTVRMGADDNTTLILAEVKRKAVPVYTEKPDGDRKSCR